MRSVRLKRDDVSWCINNERCSSDVMAKRPPINDSSPGSTTTKPPAAAPPSPMPTISKKEQDRIDFYNTYDVMTGVRIAATLGGFFGLMVILVIYKSKSKTEKALEDPRRQAAAVAEAEEEERQIAAALEATAYEQLNPTRKTRRSLDLAGGVSPRWIRNTTRFSSVGGYSSLMEPPTRMCSRVVPCSIDEDSPPEDSRIYDELYTCYSSHLDVPNRRLSSITCSSSGSSYLERRGSSVILGLPSMPIQHRASRTGSTRRRQSSPLPEHYDFYYPIDIRVIQPTPGGSPCGSDRRLHDEESRRCPPRGRAPLASISSCNTSFATDYPDMEMQSYASDSVFRDMGCCEDDTDDEIDPFSTDSDEDVAQRPCCSKDCVMLAYREPSEPLPTISDESTSTLVEEKGAGIDVEAEFIDEDVEGEDQAGGEREWSQETLF